MINMLIGFTFSATLLPLTGWFLGSASCIRSLKSIPGIRYMGEVWRSRWAIHPTNIFNFQIIVDQRNFMWPHAVIHENETRARFTSDKPNIWFQDNIPIPHNNHRASFKEMDFRGPMQHNILNRQSNLVKPIINLVIGPTRSGTLFSGLEWMWKVMYNFQLPCSQHPRHVL